MSKLNILIAEDREKWQKKLKIIVMNLGGNVTVEIADNFTEVLSLIKNKEFDLVTMDLNIPKVQGGLDDTSYLGMELMKEMNISKYNQNCGLIVLTAFPTVDNIKQSIIKLGAFDFVEKQNFDNHKFLITARAAILKSRINQVIDRKEQRVRLKITYNEVSWLGYRMSGPDHSREHTTSHPKGNDFSDLIRRTDDLNMKVLMGEAGQ